MRRSRWMSRMVRLSEAAALGLALAAALLPASAGAQVTKLLIISNQTPIVGHDCPLGCPAASQPYPSTITVTGMGAVQGVEVTVSQVATTTLNDMGLLLVGPEGHSVMLQRGAGGFERTLGVTYTFSDGAPAPIPYDTLPPDGGRVQPYDYHDPEIAVPLPAPAPAGPYGARLSVFYGSNPNGHWRLYAADFFVNELTSINSGWGMHLWTDGQTLPPKCDILRANVNRNTVLCV